MKAIMVHPNVPWTAPWMLGSFENAIELCFKYNQEAIKKGEPTRYFVDGIAHGDF